MRKILVLSCIIVAAIGQINAQDYRAIVAHGRSYLANTEGFYQIESGELLADSSRIELVDNAWLMLMDRKGRVFNLSQEGSYNLAAVDLSVRRDSSQLFFDLWTGFYENVVGPDVAVSNNQMGSSQFQLFVPSSSEFYGDKILLRWTDTQTSSYEVQLLDEFEKPFGKFKTAQNHLKLDMLSRQMVWRRQAIIRVLDLEHNLQTGLYALRKLTPPDLDDANLLIRQLPEGNDPISILTKAVFFEQRGWISDVHTLLFPLVKEDEVIRVFYEAFLIRNLF